MNIPENLNLNDVAERALAGAERLVAGAERFAQQRAAHRAELPPPDTTFRDALRARTSRAIATPALVGLNVAVFFMMAFRADGPLSDPKTILEWGGSFGPRTTNGEWWRVVTSMFIHTGFLQLLVNMAGLLQPGLIVERLLGRVAVVTTYLAAGMLGVLLTTSDQPLAVTSGSSTAVFGIYGLFIATFLAGLIQRSPASIPLKALKPLAPAAGIFMLFSLASGGPHLAGLSMGFACGSVLAIGASLGKPGPGRVALVGAAAIAALVVIGFPLRGIADVRPEIARIAALEDRLMSTYEVAIDRFKKGRMQPEALAKFIEKEIMPDLVKARARLEAIRGVPSVHKPVVADALEYFRLRQDSFTMRTEAIRKSSLAKLRQAEGVEMAARQALDKIRPVGAETSL
jgi:membrane associated rhomboid family serine protease